MYTNDGCMTPDCFTIGTGYQPLLLLLSFMSEDTECHTANGSDYKGTQSQIESSESESVESSSTHCVQWNETNSNYSTLPGNYCRYIYHFFDVHS